MKKVSLILLTFSLLIIFFSGCYKFKHNYIMKGEFHIGAVELEGGSSNLMEGILPNYVDGDGDYIVHCLDNGVLRAEYYAYDTLVYYRTGTWNMPDKNHVYYDVDVFIDGTFLIEPAGKDAFLLTSEDNYIEFFNLGSVKMVIRFGRGTPIDPDLTRP